MIHSFVIGLTLSITSGSEFSECSALTCGLCSLVLRNVFTSASLVTAVTFHQLFEGLSLGTRIATLPTTSRALRPSMMMSFATTAPIGIVAGLLLFASPHGSSYFLDSPSQFLYLT